jgi:hypothetical protein
MSPINAYSSFMVATDGSKEGWSESDAGDARRKAFIAWLDTQRFEDGSTPFRWVEVQYGDEEGETVVCAHSDEKQREIAGVLA